MMRVSSGFAALGAVLLTAAAAAAQPPSGGAPGGQPPPAPTNLQVLPKDTSGPQLIQTMEGIAGALGVQCVYCHVREGRGGRNDMAADDKQPKKTARQMMLLVRDINEKMPTAVGKLAGETTRVGCATCHRGVAIPKQLTDVVADAAATSGSTAGLAQYKELRAKYYGGQSYDFSEASLQTLAQRATAASKPDDAIAYLQANIEYFPKSARNYQLLSRAQAAKKDNAAAIAALEKAIELDPNNAQFKQQLENLKK